MAYPPAVAETFRDALGLDGSGRLLDVGCGPGSLTVLLASLFEEATGVDADADMLAQAARAAAAQGVANVDWRHMRAEELPGDLGQFDVVTFAQSFHWLDRARVAAAVRSMLRRGGACVHVQATTHEGVDDDAGLPHPRPPQAEISALVRRYLGATRQSGTWPTAERHTGRRGGRVPARRLCRSGDRRRARQPDRHAQRRIRSSRRCSRSPVRPRTCSAIRLTPSSGTCATSSTRPARPAPSPSGCGRFRWTSGDPSAALSVCGAIDGESLIRAAGGAGAHLRPAGRRPLPSACRPALAPWHIA